MTEREAINKIARDEGAFEELKRLGFVCVPRDPTPEMIEAAWSSALAENASVVWDAMIESCDLTESGNQTQGA
jgi:hypothetical protein